VNHRKHFKHPVTEIHTNTIEGTWNGLKQSIIPRYRNKKDIKLHIKELLYGERRMEKEIYGQNF
jgi:hypothetical protein